MTFLASLKQPSAKKDAKQRRTSSRRDARRGVYILLLLIVSSLFPVNSANAKQGSVVPPEVEVVFEQMSPEERVGQLFLVTFSGNQVTPDTPIYNLIYSNHIGGVVLLASNDNFTQAPATISDTYDLIHGLQQTEWENSFVKMSDPVTGAANYSEYVPLFIGISQEGDGFPTDQILNGLTPLPSEMAIGATWNPILSQQAGEVMGRELTALGFNLFLGLSLDVLEVQGPQSTGDFGTRAFGGDPYWVGEMGRAYIAGLHGGSQNRLLVVAKHFPGRGGTDRSTDAEVATIRKSLEQLKQIELAPFFAVTGNAPTLESTVDGLLVSHIRYQGFQGNIRATTRPVSFDAQALSDLMLLPQFSAWRETGGLVISDDLGSNAVREFYSLSSDGFSARVVARDAFLAGNDLLYMGHITSNDSPDTYSTVVDVINFFSKKYREDPAFAARVDTSVKRILTRKYNLFGSFSVSKVNLPQGGLTGINVSNDLSFEVARQSATLISPEVQDLSIVLPQPPRYGDRLVFITDSTQVFQCTACEQQPSLDVGGLQQAVLRLYGPDGGKQTDAGLLSSYSFDTLHSLLDGTDTSFLGSDIDRADWVVVSISDSTRSQPQLLSRFLLEKQAKLQNKKIILFSFGAPYYFDATDISKFTAYFALYSKQPAFIDVAARLLYQELSPHGASPVSIPGIGYDLISVTTPDKNQIIPLFLDLDAVATPQASTTLEPTAVPLYRIGDTIAIRTGPVLDNNGNPVPDGTIVRFSMDLTGEGGGILQQVDAATVKGIARASFGLDKPGLLQIHAESEPAVFSELLQLDVSAGGSVAVTLIVPVLSETVVPTLVVPQAIEQNPYVTDAGYPNMTSWFIMTLFIFLLSILAFWSGARIFFSQRAGARMALSGILGSLLIYNLFAFGLFGLPELLLAKGFGRMMLFVVIGFCSGWIIAFVQMRKENTF